MTTKGLTMTGLAAPVSPDNPVRSAALSQADVDEAFQSLIRGFDAAVAPQTAPPGCQAVLGYLGPDPAATHAWSLDDWLRFSHLRQLPVWVADLNADPVTSARTAAAAAKALGFVPFYKHRRAILADMETLVDKAWVNALANEIWELGYTTWLYGSLGFVLDDPARGGYLVADWDDIADIPPGHSIVGHQYLANVPYEGTSIDFDVIDSSAIRHLGVGPRRLVAA